MSGTIASTSPFNTDPSMLVVAETTGIMTIDTETTKTPYVIGYDPFYVTVRFSADTPPTYANGELIKSVNIQMTITARCESPDYVTIGDIMDKSTFTI